jgi:uncharacterized membrane protein
VSLALPAAVRRRWPRTAVRPRPTSPSSPSKYASVAVGAGFFAVYAVYSLSRFAQFATGAYDLGIFDQAVRAYAHLRAPVVPIKGDGYLVLGDHFHPIIALLAPAYWVWDDPRVLLLAQAALVAASAVLVLRFATRRLGPRAGLLVAVGYGAGWAVQVMVQFDFHEVAFALPLLAWALDALDRHRDRELLVAAGLLLLVREDMGALVAVLGLLRLVQRPVPPSRARWVPWAMIGGGLAVCAVVVAVVVPAFSPTGRYTHWDYHGLGATPRASALAIALHPLHAAALLVTPDTKMLTFVALLAPVGFLALASPYALVALPLLLERFWDDRPGLWTTHFHYNAPIWVVFVLAAVDGWSRLPLRRSVWARRIVLGAFVLAPLVATTVLAPRESSQFPLGRMTTGRAFTITAADHDRSAAAAHVPRDTCVVAGNYLATHLTAHHVVTLTRVSHRHQDFFVLDLATPEPPRRSLGGDIGPLAAYVQALAAGYRQTFEAGDVVVLRAPDYRGPSARCTP